MWMFDFIIVFSVRYRIGILFFREVLAYNKWYGLQQSLKIDIPGRYSVRFLKQPIVSS